MQIVENSEVKDLVLNLIDCIYIARNPNNYKDQFRGQRFNQIFLPAFIKPDVKKVVLEILSPTYEVNGIMFAHIYEYTSLIRSEVELVPTDTILTNLL
jgi:hypothetical protein